MTKPVLRRAAVAFCIALSASPVLAQFAPTLDGEVTVVDALIVRAFGGPPWWRVSDADSTVYVLADPGGLPPGLELDEKLLDRRLTGAKELILPPKMDIGPLAIVAAPSINRLMRQLNDSEVEALEPALPPETRARFVTIREKIGMPAKRYGALTPGTAAVALHGDVVAYIQRTRPPQPKGQAWRGSWDVMTAAARRHRVRVRHADSFGGLLLADAAADINRLGMPCMTSTLDLLEGKGRPGVSEAQHRAAVVAWSEGDIKPLLDLGRQMQTPEIEYSLVKGKRSLHMRAGTEECQRAIPAVMRARERNVQSQVDAIANALRGKQHAVALVDPVSIAMTGGVLDRLRRRGYTVKSPGEQ